MKGFICVYRGCIQNSQHSHFLIKLNKLLVFIGSKRCIQLPNEYFKKADALLLLNHLYYGNFQGGVGCTEYIAGK